jgi:hypothetical protein
MALLPLLSTSQVGGSVGKGPGGTSNCILWLKTDKQHVNAPEVVELGGGNEVITWYDQSGIGQHVSQSVSSWRPIYIEDGVQLLDRTVPSILFDGVDDFLLGSFSTGVSGFQYDGNTSGSIFVVFRASLQNSTMFSLRDTQTGDVSADGTSLALVASFLSANVETNVISGILSEIPAVTPYTDIVFLYEVVFDPSDVGAEAKLYTLQDGLLKSLALSGATLKADANEVNIGRFGSDSGTGPAFTDYFTGELLEVIVYSEANESTRTTVEAYISSKWEIDTLKAGTDPIGLDAGVVWYKGEDITSCTPDVVSDWVDPFFIFDAVGLVDTWPDATGQSGRTLVQTDIFKKPLVRSNIFNVDAPFVKVIAPINGLSTAGSISTVGNFVEFVTPTPLNTSGEIGMTFAVVAKPTGFRSAETQAPLFTIMSSTSGDYVQLQFRGDQDGDIDEGLPPVGRSLKIGAEVSIGGTVRTLEADQYITVIQGWYCEIVLLVDFVRGTAHLVWAPLFSGFPLHTADFSLITPGGSATVFDNVNIGGSGLTQEPSISVTEAVVFNKYLRNTELASLDSYFRSRYEAFEPGIPTGVSATALDPTTIDITWSESSMPITNTAWNGIDIYRGNSPDFLPSMSNLRASGISPGTETFTDGFKIPSGHAVFYKVGPCHNAFRSRTSGPAAAYPGFSPVITTPLYSFSVASQVDGHIHIRWLVRFINEVDLLTTDVEVYFDTSSGLTSGTGTLLGTFSWPDVVHTIHTGLTPSVTYYYIIRAITTLGPAADSSEQSTIAVAAVTSCT